MKYYVNQNAQSNGDHEVHTENCQYLPASTNRKYLGDYSSCKPAADEAKKTYSKAKDVKHVVLVAIQAKNNKHLLKKLGEKRELNFIKILNFSRFKKLFIIPINNPV